jgi:His/Glu/Gln/Arg/opine family amino acid ABC transporter permease subunit
VPIAFVDILTDNLGEWSSGFWLTVRIVVVSFLIAMVVGTVIAAFRVAPNKWLQRVGGLYVEFFRNIPLLVLLFLLFYGLREKDGPDIPITGIVAGMLGLGLYTAAYIAEALRSGVFSVSKGQIEASLSLGLTYGETMRRIILPQAFRTVISPIGSLIIAMVKNSAVVGVAVAVTDTLKVGRVLNSRTFETEAAFFWAAVGYLVLTGLVTVAIRQLENRYAIKR